VLLALSPPQRIPSKFVTRDLLRTPHPDPPRWGGAGIPRCDRNLPTSTSAFPQKKKSRDDIKKGCRPTRRPTRTPPIAQQWPAAVDTPPPSSTISCPAAAPSPRRAPVGRARRAVRPSRGCQLPEDELLGWLREAGQIYYPSPLIGRLRVELPRSARRRFCGGLNPRARPDRAGVAGKPRGRGDLRSAARGDERIGAAQDQGVSRVRRATSLGQGEQLPWVGEDARSDGSDRAPAGAGARDCELDCPWDESTCAAQLTAGTGIRWCGRGGTGGMRISSTRTRTAVHLPRRADPGGFEVASGSREHHCPWNEINEIP